MVNGPSLTVGLLTGSQTRDLIKSARLPAAMNLIFGEPYRGSSPEVNCLEFRLQAAQFLKPPA